MLIESINPGLLALPPPLFDNHFFLFFDLQTSFIYVLIESIYTGLLAPPPLLGKMSISLFQEILASYGTSPPPL